MSKPTLTVIDDEEAIAELIMHTAEPLGFHTDIQPNGRLFLKSLASQVPDVIVLDLVMPDMDGIEVLQALADRKCRAAIILMSGYEKGYLEIADVLGSAHGLNILGTITKPFQLKDMEALLNKARPAH